jgi:hypothetical protein
LSIILEKTTYLIKTTSLPPAIHKCKPSIKAFMFLVLQRFEIHDVLDDFPVLVYE